MDATVNYNKTANSEEAYSVAKEVITPEYIAKWNVKAEVNFDDSAKTIEATGKGFTLSLHFDDNQCAVHCKLSMLLKPMKGMIVGKVQEKLERTI